MAGISDICVGLSIWGLGSAGGTEERRDHAQRGPKTPQDPHKGHSQRGLGGMGKGNANGKGRAEAMRLRRIVAYCRLR